MKLLVACDEHDLSPFFAALARCAPLSGAEILFAHVVDTAIAEHWNTMAGHHWFRRHADPRGQARFEGAALASAQEILREALDRSAGWAAALRRPIELRGNPERELVRLALAERADLLAVGQHRLELGPHALGRCARFVVDHAPCPVLVVRGDAVRAAGEALLGDRLNRKPPEPRAHH